MAVVVEPAYFTAKINVKSEMTVDRNASARIYNPAFVPGMADIPVVHRL